MTDYFQMLWHRKVLKEHVDSEDKETLALQALAKKIQKDERVDCNLLIEGDGLMLAFKR